MSDLFLDLRDKPRVIDFLVMASPYANKKTQTAMEKIVRSYQDGEHISTDLLANDARKLAIETWPARYAVSRYLAHEGAKEEWDLVTAAVRPSTAHLMKRFKASVKAKTLDEMLKHDDVGSALRNEETDEIAHIREQVREQIWKDKKEELAVLIKDGEREREQFKMRFAQLRDLAVALPPSMQEEVFSKLARYEDRIMFNGEVLPVEMLDEEIKYYTEQKEVSPTDAGALGSA